MEELLEFLNKNSGALTVLFTAVVTIATAVYAALTWVLVKETRMMREVQTEPKLQVTVSSFDFAIHIVRLHIRNVGLGPALNVTFKPKVLSGARPQTNFLQSSQTLTSSASVSSISAQVKKESPPTHS